MKLTKDQITAIRCAHADLKEVKRLFFLGQLHSYDWEAHEESIIDLENAFKEKLVLTGIKS